MQLKALIRRTPPDAFGAKVPIVLGDGPRHPIWCTNRPPIFFICGLRPDFQRPEMTDTLYVIRYACLRSSNTIGAHAQYAIVHCEHLTDVGSQCP